MWKQKKITFKNGILILISFYRIAHFLTLMSVKVTNNMEKNSLQENTTHIKIKKSRAKIFILNK